MNKNRIGSTLQTIRQLHGLEITRVHGEETTSTQRHDTSKDKEIRNTPQDGTHKLHLRLVEEQRGTGYHEEKQNSVTCSRHGSYSCDEKRWSPQ